MAHSLSLTAIFEPDENDWVQARIGEIPGVITAAPTRAEAEELLLDALREYLLSFQVDPPPSDHASETTQLRILLTA
jgi:predicted RNase H-like HicB family nuclease